MEPVEKMIVELSALHEKVVATGQEIGSQTIEVDQQIDLYYEELHKQLQQQREELKRKLQEMSTQKKKAILQQMEQIEHARAQLESVKELNDAMQMNQETSFVQKQVSGDVKRITECYKKLYTNPVELATMKFVPVKQYGESIPLLYDNCIVPANCEVIGIPLQPLVRNTIGFKIITKDHNNAHCSKEGNHIIAQVQPSRGDVVPVEVKDSKDGSYSASFVTKQVGEAKLSVIIEGEHIRGSPYSVMIYQDYKSIDKPMKIINDDGKLKMSGPWGVAFGKDGVWAVADCYEDCVYISDGEDQLVKKFGCNGRASGKFAYVHGLAFDANNHLYVSEFSNHRIIQKVNISGEFLLQFSHEGTGDGRLLCPCGITIHNERLYVADNQRILVFQLNGQFYCIIGSGLLTHAWDVTVSSNGHLLVTDGRRNYIFSFTLDGNYVGRFNKCQLSSPVGLTTDMYGFVLVADDGNHRVTVFDQDGVCVCHFGYNSEDDCFYGITVSPNGDIYITDCENRKIRIF